MFVQNIKEKISDLSSVDTSENTLVNTLATDFMTK